MATLQDLIIRAIEGGPVTAQEILTQAISQGASSDQIAYLARQAGLDVTPQEIEQYIAQNNLQGTLPAFNSIENTYIAPGIGESATDLIRGAVEGGPVTGQNILTQAIEEGMSSQNIADISAEAGLNVTPQEIEQYIAQNNLQGTLPQRQTSNNYYRPPATSQQRGNLGGTAVPRTTPIKNRKEIYGVDIPETEYGINNYGLAGAESALGQSGIMGLDILQQGKERSDSRFSDARNVFADSEQNALSAVGGGRERIGDIIRRGIGATEGLQSFVGSGQQASQMQAALSGALGPEAQASAFAAYEESPGVSFLRSQGERALLRNSAARGGLGGGNLSRDLVDYGQGVALQDLNNVRAQLGEIASRGTGAASGVAQINAGLRGQQAGYESGLAGLESSISQNAGRDISNLLQNQGALDINQAQYASSIPVGIGRDISGFRYGTGNSLANAELSTSSALADLISQQGQDLDRIYGEGTTNIGNLINTGTMTDYNRQLQLANQLGSSSSIASGQGSGLPPVSYSGFDYLTSGGNALSGIGSFIDSLGKKESKTSAVG